jgi:nucleoside-diphosphate-sugar epimerase
MRVFITGATGFIGSALVPELINAGHQVRGLVRSEAGAKALAAAGAQAHRGELEDHGSLLSGAAGADAVIHLAFIHDFSKFNESSDIDRQAIEVLGAGLAGSNRSLIVSSGIGPWTAPGRLVTEEIDPPPDSPMPRISEQCAMALVPQGVKAGVMRLPQVHDTVKQGLVTYLITIAREKGVSAYVDDGLNRWPTVHVLDAARLFRLALERHEAGAKYHAVGEEGVLFRDIAAAIGRGLKVPVVSIPREEATTHFGFFFGTFAGLDMAASSALTQKRLGWRPTEVGMITDLDHMQYPTGGP